MGHVLAALNWSDMDDDRIRLRPFDEADLWLWHRLATDETAAGPFEWFGFGDPHRQRRRWEEDGFLGKDPRYLAVSLLDGTVAGLVMRERRRTTRAGAPRVSPRGNHARSGVPRR